MGRRRAEAGTQLTWGRGFITGLHEEAWPAFLWVYGRSGAWLPAWQDRDARRRRRGERGFSTGRKTEEEAAGSRRSSSSSGPSGEKDTTMRWPRTSSFSMRLRARSAALALANRSTAQPPETPNTFPPQLLERRCRRFATALASRCVGRWCTNRRLKLG